MPEGNRRDLAFQEFLPLWEELLRASAEAGTVVVVEGDRDRRALRRIGVRGPVALLHRGVPLGVVAHALGQRYGRAIVLTDWDTEGGHLARRLKEFLQAGELTLDLELRRRLAHVLRGEIVHVEGLAGWARRMAERSGTTLEERLEGLGE